QIAPLGHRRSHLQTDLLGVERSRRFQILHIDFDVRQLQFRHGSSPPRPSTRSRRIKESNRPTQSEAQSRRAKLMRSATSRQRSGRSFSEKPVPTRPTWKSAPSKYAPRINDPNVSSRSPSPAVIPQMMASSVVFFLIFTQSLLLFPIW